MAHVDRMGRCLRLGGLEIGVGPFPHPPFSTPFEVLPLDLRKFVRRDAEHYVPVRYVGEVYADERLGADTRHGLRHTTPDVPPVRRETLVSDHVPHQLREEVGGLPASH